MTMRQLGTDVADSGVLRGSIVAPLVGCDDGARCLLSSPE